MFAAFHWIGVVFHYVVFYLNLVIIAGFGVAGFVYSPLFKQVFLGVAVGALALQVLNADIVGFGKKADVPYCVQPKVDANGPSQMCWHSTDSSRGFGYWGACNGS